MNTKYAFVIALFALCFQASSGQIFSVSTGGSLYIATNTIFDANGLKLVPSSNFTISGPNSITKNATLSSPPGPNYVSRVYFFSATASAYSGTIQIKYEDLELNGLTESLLQINNHNGTAWSNFSSTTNDIVNNYVLSNAVSGITLKEIALASSSNPLPVNWLYFTAIPQGKNALIKWGTAQEINTHFFEVHHSTNGLDFVSIQKQLAAGNSIEIKNYLYLHTNPAIGINYYRILQQDFDGASTYSTIRNVDFNQEEEVVILGNPIHEKMLKLQIKLSSPISIYTVEGKLILEKSCESGFQEIDLTHCAKGVYLLKVNNTTKRFYLM